MRGVVGERLECDRSAVEIIDQRVHMLVKQRQPMLHAGIAAPLAHRLVELVVPCRGAEGFHIAQPKAPDRIGGELEFRHRHEIERAQVVLRALGLRIEGADGLNLVAEEIEPHRLGHAGREQVEDAPAHGIVAGLAHGGGADIAIQFEPARDPLHRQHVAGRRRQRLPHEEHARRHPLQDRIDRGENDRGPVARGDIGEPRQRGHALREHACMRRHAVIGQAVPGREFQQLNPGREKGKPAAKGRHPRPVTAHDQQADRRRIRSRSDGAREVADNHAFGTVGDARKGERPAALQEFGRRWRHQRTSPLWKRLMRASSAER